MRGTRPQGLLCLEARPAPASRPTPLLLSVSSLASYYTFVLITPTHPLTNPLPKSGSTSLRLPSPPIAPIQLRSPQGVAVGALAVVHSKITRVMRDTPGGLPTFTHHLAATADADRTRAAHRQRLIDALVPAAPQFMDPTFVEARKVAFAQARAVAVARAQRRAERRARGAGAASPPPVDTGFSFDSSFDAGAAGEAAAGAAGLGGDTRDDDGAGEAGEGSDAVAVAADEATGGGGEALAPSPTPSLAPASPAVAHPPPSRPALAPAPSPALACASLPAPSAPPATSTTTYASRSASMQPPHHPPPATSLADPRRSLQPSSSAPSVASTARSAVAPPGNSHTLP